MKFAYLAAVSVAVIAQAASAQSIPQSVTNQKVTLKDVNYQPIGYPTEVTLANGVRWSFTPGSTGATVGGRVVDPKALTVGMTCVLNGTKAQWGNTIRTLAC